MPFHTVYCEDTDETITSYADYLRSLHWKNIKDWFWKTKAKKYCYICKSRKDLNLHHKTYKRLGHEKWIDLVYLCERCHHYCHAVLKSSKRKGGNWGIAKHVRKQYERNLISLDEENPTWAFDPTKRRKPKEEKKKKQFHKKTRHLHRNRILVLTCKRCGEVFSSEKNSAICPSCER